jgi:hypothetical protein
MVEYHANRRHATIAYMGISAVLNACKSRRTAWLAVPLCALLAGCDRGVRPDELGRVIFTDPEVPGSRDAYPLPQLNQPKVPAAASSEAKTQ